MRRLSLLAIALVVALIGARLITTAEPLGRAPLRDGILLLIVGALLFGTNGYRLDVRSLHAIGYRWPAPGRVLALTGIICAIVGGLFFAVDSAGRTLDTARVVLWLLGLLMLTAGVFLRGAAERYAMPGYRWQHTSDGRFTRVPTAVDTVAAPERIDPRLPTHLLWLVAVLVIGALVRLRQLDSLPPGCVGLECRAALELMEGTLRSSNGTRFNPLYVVAELFYLPLDNPVQSLRLSASLFGLGALGVCYPVLRRVVSPAAALIGVLLLALSPLHIVAGRTAQLWLPLTLWFLLALAFIWRGLQAGKRTDWTPAGLCLGFAGLTAPALLPGLGLWTLTVIVLAVMSRDRWIDSWRLTPLALFAAGAVAPLLPLLAGHGFPPSAISGGGLLPVLPAAITTALAAAGMGTMVRSFRTPAVASLMSGMVLLPVTLYLLTHGGVAGENRIAAAPDLLLLLPFALVAATIAVDQVLTALIGSWRPLVHPSRLAFGVMAIIAVALVLTVGRLSEPLRKAGGGRSDPMSAAILDAALADLAAAETKEHGSIVFVPPSVLNRSDAQLRARAAIDAGALRPLDGLASILQPTEAERRVLVPPTEHIWQELLQAYFPDSSAIHRFDNETNSLLYTEVVLPPQPSSLRLNPAAITDDWSGSLLVDQPGAYTFSIDGSSGDSYTFLLDNKLLLDSSLGLTSSTEILAQGVYRLDLRFEPAQSGNRAQLSWTRPDGVNEVLPTPALSTLVLPNLGLLATYFSGDDFMPPALELRKDLFLEETPAPEFPYSVIWTGKLAANRAGEYLLALVADGTASVLVDGVELVLLDPNRSGEDALGYAEGIAYLEPGWHEFAARFAPRTAESTIQLLWQPPGGQPTGLSPLYLRPVTGALTVGDEPLPPTPQLTDPRLERGDFALTQGVELRQVWTGLLPSQLPVLPIAQRWQTEAGCGSGPGRFERPHGTVLDAATGRVYVADTGNGRIAVFDRNGVPLPALAPDILVEPVDVDLLEDGTLVVLDAMRQQVIRVDVENGTATPLGSPGDFYRPRGLSVMADDIIAVADTGGGRIALLTNTGGRLYDYGGRDTAVARGQPVDTAGTARDLWAVTAEDGRLWEMNIPGSVTVIDRTVSVDGPQLAVRSDDSFFLSDPSQGRVLYHNADGRPIAQLGYTGTFALPTGVTTADIDGVTLLAVVDTVRCSLSVWQLP